MTKAQEITQSWSRILDLLDYWVSDKRMRQSFWRADRSDGDNEKPCTRHFRRPSRTGKSKLLTHINK